ncbi:MAG: hypothetical protein GYB31_19300 [Bacteroidetes bacterium]|nr:hypothetical protein [Bacteroidota bacterium]
MKRIIFLLSLVCCAHFMQAQDNTLLGRSGRFGIFVSPMIESGMIGGERANLPGAGLAFVIGNGFLGVYTAAGIELDPIIDGIAPEQIDMLQAGLWLGYTPGQNALIHPIFDFKAGWGAIDFDYDDLDDPVLNDFFDINDFDEVDNVVVFQPAIGLEMNVTSFLRIHFNAGYRWTEGVNQPSLSDSDFSGWSYTAGLKLGFFGWDNRRYHHHHHNKRHSYFW